MIITDNNLCDLCGTCVAICPENCITLFETYLSINSDNCTKCLKCIKVCPFNALSLNTTGNNIIEN